MKTQNHTKKSRRNRQQVTLEILQRRFQIFVKADKEIAKRGGSSPGVEALMTHQLETEDDPRDLAARYCFMVLKWPWERVRKFTDPVG
jgi:hypothetical protein